MLEDRRLLTFDRADAVALRAEGRIPLSYCALAAHIERIGETLRHMEFGRHHRIALVLPNGPELATAFLSISESTACAPLNPAYTTAEFLFYLADLGAGAVATIPGFCPAAEEAARSLSIPLIEVRPNTAKPAGTFELAGTQTAPRTEHTGAYALLLHSSGTTARPKLVGLTHDNLRVSMRQIADTLRLTPEDTTLSIMPLFHIHGLAGALLSSLSAGASVYCSPGFDALRFGRWLEDSGATWYTGVPSMHQALLRRGTAIAPESRARLRFVRSSSAHLHTPVWRRMEEWFGCPVLNAYGMTEAAHQISSNPLPPGERRYGTVGTASAPELAVVDDKGEPRPAGTTGEVAIRGASVTQGYLSPPEANESSFVNGWLRTGDEGVRDEDGFVKLTGRLKELINCGGEKISPAEVDAVLAEHPAVSEAAAFGAPCDRRGERVCAAVVLRASATESELRNFVRDRLAAFKALSKIYVVDEIPKGPTGKVQRRNLAGLLSAVSTA